MGDAILRIPRDARVRAYRTRDTYDGVVPATSKRQPYCHSSYIELSASNAHQSTLHIWVILLIPGRYCDMEVENVVKHFIFSLLQMKYKH